MEKKDFYYLSSDGKTKIHAVEWLPEGEPKAILQIAHGVTEHMLRYGELAEFFTDRGIIVTGNDQIGHGTSIAEGAEPMYFGPTGSFNYAVEDVYELRQTMAKKFPGLPHCLLGFSLGSFLARDYLIHYKKETDGVILIGTGQTPPLQIALAKWIAAREGRRAGEEHATPLIRKLTFGTYNKKFAPNRTDYNWLCSNDEALDAYIADPLRGENFSAGLFRELLSSMSFTGKLKNIRQMDKNVPVLFMSGAEDSVGEDGKGVKKAYFCFKKAGMQNVELKLYPDLRHDILHEKCNRQVFENIYQWMGVNNLK